MASSQEQNRTVWVGDIESWMDEAFLSQCFSAICPVSNIKLIRAGPNFSAGYAFIEFASRTPVDALMTRLDGRKFQAAGHSFRLNWAQYGLGDHPDQKGAPRMDVSVYVGGLDASVREPELFKLFSRRFSSVLHAKVVLDPATQLSKCFGFVKFRDPKEAEQAIFQMQGIYLGSKQIKVKPAMRNGLGARYAERDSAEQRESSFAALPLPPPPPAALVAPAVQVLCIGGLDAATPEDCKQLLERCLAFGVILRSKFIQGSCLVEFREVASADAVAAHLAGDWNLPVHFTDSSVMDMAPSSAGAWAAITNETTAQAQTALQTHMEHQEPGLKHFQALLQDQRFVRAFEELLRREGAASEQASMGLRASLLLEDKPELFGRPADECMKRTNEDFFATFGGLGTVSRAPVGLPDEMSALA